MFVFRENPVDAKWFAPFEPDEILHDLDGPRTFTFRNGGAELFLAHWFDVAEESLYYAVVPFSLSLLKRLKEGDISLRDSLNQPRQWILEVAHDWRILGSFAADFDSLPPGSLPDPDVMLYAHLRPLFTLRAKGDQLQEGFIPSSVLRTTIERAERAIRVLVEHVFDATGRGRRAGLIRRYYNLPTQRLAFGSLEISFRPPVPATQLEFGELEQQQTDEDTKVLGVVSELLQRGLRWLAESEGSLSPVGQNPAEGVAILKSLENLYPTPQSPVSLVELSGRLLESGPQPIRRYTLRRTDGVRLRRARALSPQVRQQDIQAVGKIRELDRDSATFQLREIAGEPDAKFSYDDDSHLDIILEAIGSESRYRVIGVRELPDEVYQVLRIFPVDGPALQGEHTP